jgi:hypothetical protein
VVNGRAVAGWGFSFVVLLLVSAGMVTVPGGGDSVPTVRSFYGDHTSVIAIAQLIGLAAAATFIPFALAVQRQTWVGLRPWVAWLGIAVSVAAVVTAVPPLWLCVVARSAGADQVSALAKASDMSDVVLFAVIACFAVAVAAAVSPRLARVVAAVVALVCATRAVLILAGVDSLELVAPLAFLALVCGLCVASLRSSAPSAPREPTHDHMKAAQEQQ